MQTILEELVATKRQRLAEASAAVPLSELKARCRDAPPAKDFHQALAASDRIRVIAEIKRSSPSSGAIRTACDAARQASRYAHGGAAAISVLTEESRFGGSLHDLRSVRDAVDLPLLRKDFLFDPYQLYEARAAGADSVLLIAEVLNQSTLLDELLALARELGMEPLVELYDLANLPWVLDCRPRIVGINNRDLRTFRVDLSHTEEIARSVPESCVLVSESGIWSVADVERVARAGADAVLVGESLMRAHRPEELIAQFQRVPRRSRRRGDGRAG